MATIDNGLVAQASFPALAPSLFEVEMFGYQDAEMEYQFNSPSGYSNLFCSKVVLPGFSLDIVERHPVFKEFYLKGAKIADEVTITWQEDHNLSVWTYHREWMSKFYDREHDYFPVGAIGKKRNAVIIIHNIALPTEETVGYSSSYAGNNFRSSLHKILLEGMTPVKNYDLDLDWASTDSPKFSLAYKVERIKYEKAGSNGTFTESDDTRRIL